MNLEAVLKQITPEVYETLRNSLQLSRWPDGRALTAEQKELCMEAIIRYETMNDFPQERRTGYVGGKKEASCGTQAPDTSEQALNIVSHRNEQSGRPVTKGDLH